jgi:hypothetical protein
MLERYFRLKMIESKKFTMIGSWWEKSGSENEIDIVALSAINNEAIAVEVKRQAKNFKPEKLAAKVKQLQTKLLPKYDIAMQCLSLNDM